MLLPPPPITLVRCTPEEGKRRLRSYVFGGMHAGRRPPRGISREALPEMLEENLQPNTSAEALMRILDTALFYESVEILPLIRARLNAREATADDVERSAWCLQMFGELGSREEAGQAAEYFDRVLVPHDGARRNLSLLLETLPTFAPHGSLDRLCQRIGFEIQAAAQTPDPRDPENAKLERLRDLMCGPAPIAVALLQARSRLWRTPPEQRRLELVGIYLGESPLSDGVTQVWAARMLRAEAREADPAPVLALFGQALDAADPEQMDPDRANFIAHRSAQAILYLGGRLKAAQRMRYEAIENGPRNFLWDDTEPPSFDSGG